MSELEELYQDLLIEHSRKPRNFGRLAGAKRSADGYNPLCGDKVILDLKVEDGVVADVGFQGSGCAISRASTSLLTESIKGKSRAEIQEIFHAFHQMVTRAPGSDFDSEVLGDLESLSGVCEFPARVKCATLAWHTLLAALEGREGSISTE